MKSRRCDLNAIRLASWAAAFAVIVTACTVTVGPALTGTGEPVVITFGLGGTGVFTISAGVPVSNEALISGLQAPSKTPEVAVLRIQPSDITVTPLSGGQDLATGNSVSGAFTVSLRMAAASSASPCADGVSLGSLSGTVTNGQVTLIGSTLSLPAQAVGFAATGAFTLCITVQTDFSAVVVISNLTVVFNPGANDLPSDNDNGAPPVDNANDNASDDDGLDNGNTNDNVNDVVNDNVDDVPNDDGSNDNSTNTNDNSTIDEPPADNANDNTSTDDTPVSRLTYVNVTNDLDQNPDSGFDARDSDATINDGGNVIAYRSNIDTTGEGGATPNAEIMVLLGSTKVQVTQTTDVTNTAGNTYEATNWGPVVSSDGAIVAFGSDGDLVGVGPTSSEQLYVYEVTTGQTRQLSTLDTAHGGIQYDWVGYPRVGGNAVAWIENDTECPTFGCAQQRRFRVTGRTGGELLTLVFDENLTFDDYALAGDGETIVFVSGSNPVGQNANGYTQLFTMAVGGGSITQVSSLSSSSAGWTPAYRRPAMSPNGDQIAVWTNDPTIASSAEVVLALLNSSGSLIRVLARAGVDFPSGDDDTGRARFSANGAYLAFATSWSFAYTQRNFRAAVDGTDLLDLGIGYKSIGPSLTADGSTAVICGVGNAFYPDQTAQNADWTDEVWLVNIAP